MTDDEMDARLHAAGSRWRATTATAATAAAAATASATDDDDPVGDTARADVEPARRSRRRHVGLLASAALVAAALVVGGVFAIRTTTGTREHNTSADQAALRNTVWLLTAYGDRAPDRDPFAALSIDGTGALVADDGCTVVGAHAEVSRDTVTFSRQVVRYYSCTDQTGVSFATGLTSLRGRADYRIDGNALTITRSGRPAMHFLAAPSTTPRPTLDVPTFVGAHWQLDHAVDAGGHRLNPQRALPFTVDDKREFSANDGCNGLSGPVTLDGPVVRFGAAISTAIGCLGAVQRLADTVDAVLRGSARHVEVGGELTITRAGAGMLVYRWVPTDRAATDPQRLVGVTWRLISVVQRRPSGTVTLRFTKGGAVTGTDGCRAFTASVTATPGVLSWRGVPSEPPASCPSAARAQATTVDSFLHGRAIFALRAGRLIIGGGGGPGFALVYAARPGSR